MLRVTFVGLALAAFILAGYAPAHWRGEAQITVLLKGADPRARIKVSFSVANECR